MASRELNIPQSYIHLSETSTVTVPNASFTAASMGADINGKAVQVTFSSQLLSDGAGGDLVPPLLLWKMKLSPREVKWLIAEHSANYLRSQDSKSSFLGLPSGALSAVLGCFS